MIDDIWEFRGVANLTYPLWQEAAIASGYLDLTKKWGDFDKSLARKIWKKYCENTKREYMALSEGGPAYKFELQVHSSSEKTDRAIEEVTLKQGIHYSELAGNVYTINCDTRKNVAKTVKAVLASQK